MPSGSIASESRAKMHWRELSVLASWPSAAKRCASAVRATVADKLRVANPTYLESP